MMTTIGHGAARPALLVTALVMAQGVSPCLAGNAAGETAPALPPPPGSVNDDAAVIGDDWERRIRGVCRELEHRAGVEMIVVTVPTVGPFPHAQAYARHVYEERLAGTARRERGLVLLVSVKERQAVVALGRTLRSAFGKPQFDRVSEHYLRPMFRNARYGESLYRAAVGLAAAAGAAREPGTAQRSSRAGFWMNLAVGLSLLAILWRVTRPEQRRPFPRWRRGDYWGTGQGGFGGNFGSFGGGPGGGLS